MHHKKKKYSKIKLMYKDILGVIKYIILVFAGEAILISFPFAGLVLMCFFQ